MRRLHTIGATAQLTELLFYQADIEYRLGRWDDATTHAGEGLRFTHETGQRPWRANLLALPAQLAAARGAGAECRRYSERALEIAFALRERAAAGLASAALGLLALGEGEADDAWTHLARLVAPGSPSAHPYTALMSIIDIVEAAARTPRPESALGFLRECESRVATNPSPAGSATVHHCHALPAGAADNSAE